MTATVSDHAIFLGGIAGSGKTRMGALLKHQPDLSVTRKTYLWREHFGRHGDLGDAGNRERCLDAVLSSPGVRRLDLDESAVRSEALAEGTDYAALFAVVHRAHAAAQGKTRWCDQLGLVETYAEEILGAMPNACMIHMICDPGRLSTPARPGVAGWTAAKWIASVQTADANAAAFPDRYLIVRFEDFAADERRTLEAVCEFLGTEIAPATVRAIDDVPERSQSQDASTETVAALVERHAPDLLDRWGYTERGSGPRRPRRGTPLERVAMQVFRRRHRHSVSRQLAGAR